MKLCAAHSMPYCRICNKVEKPAFGTVKTPLANKKRDQARMSADAEIQEGLGEKCLLLGFTEGDCVGRVCRAHLVPQQTIRDTYKHGACREHGSEFWIPTTREGAASTLAQLFRRDDIVAYETIELQQILDDNRNFIGACSAHNVDGLAMVDALDRRKVAGLASYPAGFGEFCHSFRFDIEGSTFWYYVPFDAGVAA